MARPKSTKVSEKQAEILAFIERFIEKHGYPPSVREIGTELELNSPSTVQFHITKLVESGKLVRDGRKTRAIRLANRDRSKASKGLRILGEVVTGVPFVAIETDNDILPYKPRGVAEHFALQIKTKALIGIGILEGDYIVVREEETAKQGQVVVALLGNGEIACGRLGKADGKIAILPENPTSKPVPAKNAKIWGIVEGVVRTRI